MKCKLKRMAELYSSCSNEEKMKSRVEVDKTGLFFLPPAKNYEAQSDIHLIAR